MANKNYLDSSEVPKLTGNTETDIKRLHNYLCNMAGQAGYEISNLKGEVTTIQTEEVSTDGLSS